ncbi:MAG TPA: peptidoglycan-binding protein [Gaiellaceae bacterium]|nr:peptidoglycan-binding protein [Gaiellaceae bacterium]
MRRMLLLVPLLLLAAVAAAPSAEARSADVAALQVGLRAKGLYTGTVDGIAGPRTAAGVRRLQRRAGIAVDGIVGPATRKALGRHGRGVLGRRLLKRGTVGWDVAALQFSLAWHGFPSGPLDGRFGRRTDAALCRFQRWSRLFPDGVLGPATLRALAAPRPVAPVPLAPPVASLPTDGFGPRGNRFHTGLDYPADAGTPVSAPAAGRVTYAGWLPGGWGNVVAVAVGSGARVMLAHLSRVDVEVGAEVGQGATLGLVGATGNATGPHVHLELRVRGAAVDPLSALG